MLSGKTALVTGAGRGIGRAIAVRLAAEGASVVVVDMQNSVGVAEAIAKNGGRAFACNVDISDSAAVQRAVTEALDMFGTLNILVNNAGIIARGSILELTEETWKRVIDVNLNGTFNVCKAVIPVMTSQRSGRILSITSIAGKMGDITAAAAYGTSKGAVNTLTKSLARQLAEYGITVNAVAPHAIETEMSADWSMEKRTEVLRTIPLGRMGTPEEVAEAALFLVSDGAAFITGEILDVNGGAYMD